MTKPSGRKSQEETSADQLLQACLNDRARAPWGEVVDVFWRVIASTVIKVSRRFGAATPENVDDLIHDVFVRLCKDDYRHLRESRADRPAGLYALVQAIATTTTLDHFRIQKPNLLPIDDQPIDQKDPRAEQVIQREVLIREIDDCITEITRETGDPQTAQRDRQIFWLHYRQGFTAEDIARIPTFGLTAKGVESVIHRIVSRLREVVTETSAEHKGESR